MRRAGEFDVVGALTTVTETFGRVSIHGVRQEILLAQCEAAGLPPCIVPIPYPCPNEVYEARLGEAIATAVRDGITHIIFGDLFLRDIRAYREQKLEGTGITPLFPLWERPTLPLAQAMIARARGLPRHRRPEKAAAGIRRPRIRSGNCWSIFPTASIPAARTANSIPVWSLPRSSPTASPSPPASASPVTVTPIAIW